MFKLLDETNSPVDYIRKLGDAVSDVQKECQHVCNATQEVVTARLIHTGRIGGNAANIDTHAELAIHVTKETNGRRERSRHETIVLKDGVNYSYGPLNSVITMAVEEANTFVDMVLMENSMTEMSSDFVMSNSDIVELVKNHIKDQLGAMKVFNHFGVSVVVVAGSVSEVSITVA